MEVLEVPPVPLVSWPTIAPGALEGAGTLQNNTKSETTRHNTITVHHEGLTFARGFRMKDYFFRVADDHRPLMTRLMMSVDFFQLLAHLQD